MGRTLQIGQNCCYWSANAKKPLPALCIDCDESGMATLVAFTAAGGRFTKTVGPKADAIGEGWAGVGESFH